ncbi:MAG: DUF349 domain-containing protein [Nannocystales bacterium]
MGFVDLFRPKWKHSKAAVRTEALHGLGADATDIIVEIARSDVDDTVRRVAIEKLVDPEVLSSIAKADTSPVGVFAGTRAAALWVDAVASAQDAEQAEPALSRLSDPTRIVAALHRAKAASVRRAALARLSDPRVLVDVVRDAGDSELRFEALRKISDVSTLRGLAVSGDPKEAALAAIEQLEDLDALASVAKKGKSKGIRNRAKKRLATLAPAVEPVPASEGADTRQWYAEQSRLVEAVERIVADGAFERAEQVAAVRDTWAHLAEPDAALSDRLSTTLEAFDRGYAVYAEAEAVAQAERAKKQAEDEARRAAAEERDAARKAREAERAAADEARRGREAAARAQAESRPAPTKEGPSTRREAAPVKRAPEPSPEELAEEAKENQARLEAACDELEKAPETTTLRAGASLLKHTAALFSRRLRLPSEEVRETLSARYEPARLALVARVEELGEAAEWLEWSNRTRQESLVERAQKLQAVMDTLEPAALAMQVKALQDDWKAIHNAPSAKAQALWQAFKTACDAVYTKVKGEYAANLVVKHELCERAESLQDSSDWTATAAALKDLQAEWKASGPVARSQDRKVWERFRGACDVFFARRKEAFAGEAEEMAKNAERKQVLIDKVEALLEGVVDEATWKRATDETKAVQRAWRDIGHVPRKDADRFYKSFKAACDGVFRKLDTMEAQRRAAEAQRVSEARDEAAATLASDELTAETLVALWSTVLKLGDAALLSTCREACVRALETDPAAFAGTELDPAGAMRRKAKLCERIEAVASPDAEAQSLAQQLESALASNALGLQDDSQTPESEVERARTAWERIGPTPGEDGTAMDARFAAACSVALGQ